MVFWVSTLRLVMYAISGKSGSRLKGIGSPKRTAKSTYCRLVRPFVLITTNRFSYKASSNREQFRIRRVRDIQVANLDAKIAGQRENVKLSRPTGFLFDAAATKSATRKQTSAAHEFSDHLTRLFTRCARRFRPRPCHRRWSRRSRCS